MSSGRSLREWIRFLYRLGDNTFSLIGVVLTTSSAVTLIAFWIYDFVLPGPPHPYVGILLFLILPACSFRMIVRLATTCSQRRKKSQRYLLNLGCSDRNYLQI